MNGVFRHEPRQQRSSEGHVTSNEKISHFIYRATDAFLGGFLAHAEMPSDFEQGQFFIKPEQDCLAVGFGKRGYGLVEIGFKLFPDSLIFIRKRGRRDHRCCRFFAVFSSFFCAQRTIRHKPSGSEKPAAQGGSGTEAPGLFGQEDENRLGDILGESLISGVTQGHRIHPGQMASDQFRKGCF